MQETEYVRYDGLGLAELVRNKDMSAAELLDVARRRADLVDSGLGSICRRLDGLADERAGGEALSGAFAGVPFLLKDLHQDIAGVPTANGCRALAQHVPTRTSTVVQRWLDAGLVVFGKTNTPEFGSKGVTEPTLFRPTRNPWDPGRTPGGSSGGAAAAVAAGIVPVAAASDGGGSIRIPAACCGLVRIKAGRGLVPFGPGDSEPLNGLATQGVVSRSVRDTAAMLDVLKGPEEVSAYMPGMPALPFLDELDHEPGRLRIGFTARSALRTAPHPEAVRAVEHAARLLDDLGHDVEEVEPPVDDHRLGRDFMTIWFVHQTLEVARAVRGVTHQAADERRH